MQRWTWILALLGLCGGLGVTSYLQHEPHQRADSEPLLDPTHAMLEGLRLEIERLQAELEDSRARMSRLDESQAHSDALGERVQRLEAELAFSDEKLARQREYFGRLENSSRAAAIQAVGVEFTGFARDLDTKWEGLRGQVDEVFGLAKRHEGALRELRRYQQRDTARMWSDLLGPTVQLSGASTVGSGVLLPSIALEDGRYRTYLLTAWHVVRDIQSNPRQPHEPVPVRVYHADGTRSNETARLLAHDATIDAALLLMNTEARFHFGARLATREHLERIAIFGGVYAVGCPLGNDPIPTFGEVADIRHQVDGEPYWMISAPTYIGNSGGGIFDAETHELIGLFSKIYTHGTLRPTVVPHMGLVTPLSRVYDWLAQSGYAELVPIAAPQLIQSRDGLLQTAGPLAPEDEKSPALERGARETLTSAPTTLPAPLSASLATHPSRD